MLCPTYILLPGTLLHLILAIINHRFSAASFSSSLSVNTWKSSLIFFSCLQYFSPFPPTRYSCTTRNSDILTSISTGISRTFSSKPDMMWYVFILLSFVSLGVVYCSAISKPGDGFHVIFQSCQLIFFRPHWCLKLIHLAPMERSSRRSFWYRRLLKLKMFARRIFPNH